MLKSVFFIALANDNGEILAKGAFANMELADKFFKSYIANTWDITEEEVEEEWNTLCNNGVNYNNDTLYIEKCYVVDNKNNSDELLWMCDNEGID